MKKAIIVLILVMALVSQLAAQPARFIDNNAA
ncbi:MAG: hypothetical protein ACD_39C01513G0001, partial [uncultured bacterium]